MRKCKTLIAGLVVLVAASIAYASYPKPPSHEDLGLKVEVDPSSHPSLALKATNNGAHEITLTFSTGQHVEFQVLDRDEILWTWSQDMMFTQAVTNLTLMPGESADYSSDLPALPAGTYTVRATLLDAASPAHIDEVLEVEVEESDVRIDSGRFNGRIDTGSIEVRITGVPDAIPPRVFRLSDEVADRFDSYGLDEGDVIRFEFVTNEYDQDVILEITKYD